MLSNAGSAQVIVPHLLKVGLHFDEVVVKLNVRVGNITLRRQLLSGLSLSIFYDGVVILRL